MKSKNTFKEKDKVIVLDSTRFNTNLIGNVERALSFLWKNLRARHELIPKNTRRINVLKIPSDALREALINAVTHRNYRTRGVSMMTGLKFLILEGFTES